MRYAEPNYLWRTNTVPNDARLADQWGLRSTGQSVNGSPSTADVDIDAPEAWDITTGSTDVIVAVVDSGIAYDHPDLAANMYTNPGESGGGRETTVSTRQQQLRRDYASVVLVGRTARRRRTRTTTAATSLPRHAVRPTFGAVGDNGIGVAGVACRVRLMPGRVFTARCRDILRCRGLCPTPATWGADRELQRRVPHSRSVQTRRSHPNTLRVAGRNDLRNLNSSNTYPCEVTPATWLRRRDTNPDALASFSNYGRTSATSPHRKPTS